jgi:hypothetical protein
MGPIDHRSWEYRSEKLSLPQFGMLAYFALTGAAGSAGTGVSPATFFFLTSLIFCEGGRNEREKERKGGMGEGGETGEKVFKTLMKTVIFCSIIIFFGIFSFII